MKATSDGVLSPLVFNGLPAEWQMVPDFSTFENWPATQKYVTASTGYQEEMSRQGKL